MRELRWLRDGPAPACDPSASPPNGGQEPRWTRDGRELLFFAPDNRLMAAQVKIDGESFEVGAIHPLFQARAMGRGFRYDVAPDGTRSSSRAAFLRTSRRSRS